MISTKRISRKISDKLIFVPLLFLAACGGEEAPAELPLGTAQQLMANEMQPTADIYWGSVRFESRLEEDGTVVEEEFEPSTDEEWAEVQQAAVHMQELGEMLKTPAYADGRGEDWLIFAQGLIDISAKAEQAAVDQDPDAVFTEGGNVYNVCRACHQVYPPANMPEEEGTAAG